MSKNKLTDPSSVWQPNADLPTLKARQALFRRIRQFFYDRDILEVETPLLCKTAAMDPFLQAIPAALALSTLSDNPTQYPEEHGLTKHNPPYFLQTSPEFAMKRLLAFGSGSIFQMCKAFRNSESGRLHNPEFSLLEWYHLGFDHHQLMDEMDELLMLCLGCKKADRLTYQALFEHTLDINPHTASLALLEKTAIKADLSLALLDTQPFTTDDWLNLLMTHCIEPHLGFDSPVMIYDYPKTQAALAKIRSIQNPSIPNQTIEVAERFEVYVKGLELANGYHELIDPKQQLERFKHDGEIRKALNLQEIPIDLRLVAALEHGMPSCAGVALGLDRLLMLTLNKHHIDEVLSFSIQRA